MAIINTQRPGVYTDYTVSSIMGRGGSTKFAAVAAKAASGKDSEVFVCDSYAQAVGRYFTDTENANICTILKLLFSSGVGRVYCAAVSAATQDELNDYLTALALLEPIDNIGAIICDSENPQVVAAAAKSAAKSSQSLRERIAYCGIADTAAAISTANAANSERLVICSPAAAAKGGTKQRACYTAAAFAGRVLALSDAGYNLNGLVLDLLEPPQAPLSNEQVEAMLLNGVTAFEKTDSGIECIKAVTTKTKNDGIYDSTFLSLNTILTVDEVVVSLRRSLKQRLQGAKNNEQTRLSIASQLAVELEGFKQSGLLSSYELPKVYRDSTDPSVCIAELSFEISCVVNQIHIIAQIQV
ncbi:MAG TPA: hypothetical protein DCP97_00250 [Ruminococcaceae bacterium]|nr:hypothetical protein [Oscillospiraceae bacterium]